MRHGFWALFTVLVGLGLGAQAQEIASGPAQGAAVPSLKVYDATGPFKEQEVDYPAQRKGRPSIYLFVQADLFDRPMNRFMKNIDSAIKKDFANAYVVAVWLTEDVNKTKERLPVYQQSVKYEATALTCFPGDKAGPKDWHISDKGGITVVLANQNKVVLAYGIQGPNDTDAPKVLRTFRKIIEGK